MTRTPIRSSGRRTPLMALMAANGISLIGTQVTALVLPWFVLETTGSATKTGVVGFVEGAAFFVAAFYAGVLADQIDPKRLSVVSDLLSATLIGLVPLLHATIGLAFWQLLLLVFVATACLSPGNVARRRVLPEFAALAGIRLERVNGINEMVYQMSFLAGPPLAGVLIGLLGASPVLAIDAASFVLSAAIIAVAVPTGFARVTSAPASLLDRFRGGIAFLRDEPALIALSGSNALALLLVYGPLFAVVLPVYARQTSGKAGTLGLLIAGFAAGGLLGSVAFGAVGHRLSRRRIWIARLPLAALVYGVLAWMPPLSVTLIALMLFGLATGAATPVLATIGQERVPLSLRGRVNSVIGAVMGAAVPIGTLVAGATIGGAGLRASLVLLGSITSIIAVVVWWLPSLRELDAPKARDDVVPVPAPNPGSFTRS